MNHKIDEKIAIILDTNVLYNPADFYLKKYNDAIYMLEIQDKIEYINIFIPEIVLLELAKQHSDHIEKNLSNLERISKEFKKISKIEIKGHNDLIIEEHIENLKDKLFDDIEYIIPLPNDKKELFNYILNMALEKIPPFENKGDKGFKDALIFLSIIHFAKKNNIMEYLFFTDDSIFINNKKNMEKFFNKKTGKSLDIINEKNIQKYIMEKYNLLKDFWNYFYNKFYPELSENMDEFSMIKINNKESIFNQISTEEVEITFAFVSKEEKIEDHDYLQHTIIFKKENNNWYDNLDMATFNEEIRNFISLKYQI